MKVYSKIFIFLLSLTVIPAVSFAAPTSGSLEMISLQKAAEPSLVQAVVAGEVQLQDAKDYFVRNESAGSRHTLTFKNDQYRINSSLLRNGKVVTHVVILPVDANAAVTRNANIWLVTQNSRFSQLKDETNYACYTDVDKNIGVETSSLAYPSSTQVSRLFGKVKNCTLVKGV